MKYPFQKCNEIEDESAVFTWLDKKDNEILQSHFPLPQLALYPAKLPALLKLFCQICCNIASPENVYYEQLQSNLLGIIDKITEKLPLNKQIQSFTNRVKLHQFLTHYPLYSTLLLIDSSGKNKTEQHWWFTLLARIYLYHQGLRYEDSLEFDRTLQSDLKFESLTALLKQSDIEFLTTFELKIILNELKDKQTGVFIFSSCFDTYITNKKKSLLASKNTLESFVQYDEECQIKEIQHTDDDGNTAVKYLEFEPNRELTLDQQKSIFKKKKFGMGNGIRHHNLSLPLDLSALTPQKFTQFIRIATPDLFSNMALDSKQTAFRIIFWLEVWLGKPYSSFSELKVFNDLSASPCSEEIGFHYNANTTSNDPHTLFYNQKTHLVKGKKAPSDSDLYDPAIEKKVISLICPYPLQTYFFEFIRNIKQSSHRHNKTLATVLEISWDRYRKWLKVKIGIANNNEAQTISHARIRNTFHHYSSFQLPKTDRAILQGNGVMGSFYVNNDAFELIATLQNNWLKFIDVCALNKHHLSLDESNHLNISPYKTEQNAFGAALSIKKSKLEIIIDALCEQFKLCTEGNKNKLKANNELICETLVLYLHFRTAITCAIRPVIKPIPQMDYIEPDLHLMLTKDKDAHQNDELRFLIMDQKLSDIWKLTKQLPREQNVIIESFFAEGSKSKLINLAESFAINIDPSAFRHTAASLFVTQHRNDFHQGHFNLLMNHFDYGQFSLRKYSLLSVAELTSFQQKALVQYPLLFESSDACCLALLQKLLKAQGVKL